MTRRTIPTLALLCGGWLLLGAAGTAEAGFIAASVDRQASPLADTGSSMAPPAQGENDRLPLSELLIQQYAAWMSPLAPTGSSGSAGTPTTTTSPGGAPAAVLPVAADQRSQLITMLAIDREVWLPPPFSTGIFRPPRS